ncbi:MAG: DUF814 domain-containing protein [Myxococcales bacterium]|jgi:predicted ribosome quality control (RQC) complex YloA/Tae2 family protein|nr:MAG: DUF814 domain-containing protein [Myxococcales bacterium]
MARRRTEDERPEDPGDVSRNRGRPRDFLHYRLPGDWEVIAGRSAADNDELSLRVARPDDWWFHVKGMSGSHVILRAEQDREPDRGTLEAAAGIAAFHSKARQGGIVPVSCTRARFVTKPRGASRGTVEIRKETTMKVRPVDPTDLAADPA